MSLPVTYRASDFEGPPPGESPHNYPLVYLRTTPLRKRGNKGELQVDCQTELFIWTNKPNPQSSMSQLVSVLGALASMLKQTVLDGSATAWSATYSNAYPDRTLNRVTSTPPYFEKDSQGNPTGRAWGKLTVAWAHSELVT